MRATSASRAGLTLLESAAILSAIGVMLAVAIPTLARSVRASKVAEASEQLESLYQSASAYYAVRRSDASGMVYCLPEATGPTPDAPSASPVKVDFGAETWKALGFAPRAALRYRYSFLPSVSGCGLPRGAPPYRLVLRAEGDLDGDGHFSVFERRARIEPNGQLQPEPVLHIVDRIE
jgi:type II secretory pathway pseudopilin PulG